MLTLPHTGVRIPHDRLRIHALRQLDLPTGVALTATLLHDGHPAGQIANNGDGGPTVYHPDPDTTFTRGDLATFTAACRTPGDRTPLDEHVLDLLVEEHQTTRDLATAERRGHTLARHIHPLFDPPTDEPSQHAECEVFACEYRELTKDTPQRLAGRGARLIADLDCTSPCTEPGGTWQVWTGTTWNPAGAPLAT